MQRTPAIYGAPPKVLGTIEFDTSEMMFWLYCSVKLPGNYSFTIPDNLKKFAELLVRVRDDAIQVRDWNDSYVYLSAKTLYVSPGNPGNRLGWHSDGFLTNDLNYIWSDRNPTLFCEPGVRLHFAADHTEALEEMNVLGELWRDVGKANTYPEKTLLRLDQTVLHAVNPEVTPGVRTFLKVSISDKPYALKGNSINHALNHPAPVEDRQVERNCPRGIAA